MELQGVAAIKMIRCLVISHVNWQILQKAADRHIESSCKFSIPRESFV